MCGHTKKVFCRMAILTNLLQLNVGLSKTIIAKLSNSFMDSNYEPSLNTKNSRVVSHLSHTQLIDVGK